MNFFEVEEKKEGGHTYPIQDSSDKLSDVEMNSTTSEIVYVKDVNPMNSPYKLRALIVFTVVASIMMIGFGLILTSLPAAQ